MTVFEQLKKPASFFKRRRLRRATKVVIGAGGLSYSGWFSTDKYFLDIANRSSFLTYWQPNSIDAFLAEHVWEHLSDRDASKAVANCFEFLKPEGYLRIAVPDGLHPNPEYIEDVKPGGSGLGSDDHKVLYNYKTLSYLLESAGFRVKLLEWFDETGDFHKSEWTLESGMIRRSSQFDARNKLQPLTYTSLIADATKIYVCQ